MPPDSQPSWHPDRSWADPLIVLLALLALMAAGFTLRARSLSGRRPSERASLQARMMEVALAGPKRLTGREVPPRDWIKAERQLKEPWDRALFSVLKAELSAPQDTRPVHPDLSLVPSGLPGDAFRRVCLAAYSDGPVPTRIDREAIHHRLGEGYAADLLEARLRDREDGGDPLRAQAQAALLARLAGIGLLSLGVLASAAGGLAVAIYLLVTQDKVMPQPLPAWSMSGRAATVVFLTWFLAFFLSGNAAGLLLHPWPGLSWLVLPLSYLLHAAFGVQLLCRAEGIGFNTLRGRMAPAPLSRDLAWAGAFLLLAVLLVIIAALMSNLILRPEQSPQRDLQDLLRGLAGWGPTLALFLTVAVLAPCFEELLFRGFILPVLARTQRMALALAVSALLFGAIHLQPSGLPTLSTLGLVMGLAMRHTGSLRAPIFVHACWNGCLFLLMRTFA